MLLHSSYSIFPMGDSALTIDFGNVINEEINKKILSLFNKLYQKPFAGMIEAIPAYSSLTVVYDILFFKKNKLYKKTAFDAVKEKVEIFLNENTETVEADSKTIKIPVCYDDEFGIDLGNISEMKKIDKEEIIQLYHGRSYRVYMIGFLPGFPYMGEVDERISVPRKQRPENVAPGSIAIANKQTGIYSFTSPGGWSVIGRTPLKLFDATNECPVLLNAGDMVSFYPISKEEFFNMQS